MLLKEQKKTFLPTFGHAKHELQRALFALHLSCHWVNKETHFRQLLAVPHVHYNVYFLLNFVKDKGHSKGAVFAAFSLSFIRAYRDVCPQCLIQQSWTRGRCFCTWLTSASKQNIAPRTSTRSCPKAAWQYGTPALLSYDMSKVCLRSYVLSWAQV